MSMLTKIWDEFLHKFDRLPVWIPGINMSLGDVGVVDERGFIRLANLSDFGIEYEPTLGIAEPSFNVASGDARTEDFSISAKADGVTSSIAGAKAGMRASFNSAAAFVVRAERAQIHTIDDVLSVENRIKAVHSSKKFWKRRWVYVSEVVTAEPCIVLVSASKGAEAEVVADLELGPGGVLKLADASGGLHLAVQSGLDQSVVSDERMPFMWRGRCRSGLFGLKFQDRGTGENAGDHEDVEGEDVDGDFMELRNPKPFEVAASDDEG